MLALTHTTAVQFFFNRNILGENNVKSVNNLRAKVKSVLLEFVLNLFTRQAEETVFHLSGTLPMKHESPSQASLKALALNKSFDAGRKKVALLF